MRFWKPVGALASVILLLTFASAGAFDGKRKGLLMGFGVGSGVTMFSQDLTIGTDSDASDQFVKPVISTDFKLGFGVSDQLLVYYVMQVAWFRHTDVFSYDDPATLPKEFWWAFYGFASPDTLSKDIWIASGVAGLGASYHLKPNPPSFYVTGAAGFSTWTAPFEPDDWLVPFKDHARTWFGIGVIGGVGYEFRQYWRVEATALWGNPHESADVNDDGVNDMEVTSNSLSFLVLLTGLLY